MRKNTAIKLISTGILILAVLISTGGFPFLYVAKEPDYQFVSSWGTRGTGPGQFHDPTGIDAVDNNVFVADSRNGRIQVFDLEGNLVRMFGQPGNDLGELGRPMNLTVHDDELYVPEYFNDRIQVFGLDGSPKRMIGSSGTSVPWFSDSPLPTSIGKSWPYPPDELSILYLLHLHLRPATL